MLGPDQSTKKDMSEIPETAGGEKSPMDETKWHQIEAALLAYQNRRHHDGDLDTALLVGRMMKQGVTESDEKALSVLGEIEVSPGEFEEWLKLTKEKSNRIYNRAIENINNPKLQDFLGELNKESEKIRERNPEHDPKNN